ncbi:hypothetical protein FisN_20Hu270 [Fistulifera solaris]|uniref:Dynamin N-terminal domain-containing protein n=1 Tax=Fistulifera solaris TaxID=1519565 RepID=A0A1Z5JPU6_FISSO|nr:hypothetical protein FisN_20Hu270 [Fistulifera solaris]|eukprot:GAX16055.1 hypothetical protein FisN_20Hu270 [Fistulifera solaris]
MLSANTDIKIALIGHVSVGKTTVLNALFRDKFGEVSMKRTTAGINYFRIISNKLKANKRLKVEESAEEPTEENGKRKIGIASYDTKSAGAILKEITPDNKAFRNSSAIHEKFFDIEHDEPLCDMRKDTDLVVVDVPGINEAGAGSKYRDFVEKKWHTFDVVVLVMDGKQGVNTEEQLKLLQFVKNNQETKRRVSLIILLNKVDDPDDEEQSVLVDESRKEAEKQFNCTLEKLLHNTQKGAKSKMSKLTPILIPTSAMHAYFYCTASLMTFDQFKKFDKDLIEKIGREEVGKFRWKNLSEDKKYQAVYEAVSEEGQYKERLEATNFDKFLEALRDFIGDELAQLKILQEQVRVSLKNLSPKEGLANQFRAAYEKSKAVGMQFANLSDHFWTTYNELEKQVMSDVKGPTTIGLLSEAMTELKCFHNLANQASWEEDQNKALERMRGLIRRPLLLVFEKASECTNKMASGAYLPKSPPHEWSDLSPLDWHTICNSFLLLSYNKTFCCTFGFEKNLVEIIKDSLSISSLSCAFCCESLTWEARNKYGNCGNSNYGSDYRSHNRCDSCGNQASQPGSIFAFTLDNKSELCAVNKNLYMHAFTLATPTSFSDPKHCGHLAWVYCEVIDSLHAM